MNAEDPLYGEAIAQVHALLAEAEAAGDEEPTAMTLCTQGVDGRLSARVVLLKQLDARGFVFYTNGHSLKGRQLAANPRAALVFLWKKIHRQVRVEGVTETVSDEEADAYFAGRPRGSQIGAWASLQSQVLPDRGTLEARVAEYEAKYADRVVPRPPHWSGFRVVPDRLELWFGQRHRLHDRWAYQREEGGWTLHKLYP